MFLYELLGSLIARIVIAHGALKQSLLVMLLNVLLNVDVTSDLLALFFHLGAFSGVTFEL